MKQSSRRVAFTGPPFCSDQWSPVKKWSGRLKDDPPKQKWTSFYGSLFSELLRKSEWPSKIRPQVFAVNNLPVTVAMLEPIAKDWLAAPAASDALINSWRYSRASAYSLWTDTCRMTGQCNKIFITYELNLSITHWCLTLCPGWCFYLHRVAPRSTRPSPGGVL